MAGARYLDRVDNFYAATRPSGLPTLIAQLKKAGVPQEKLRVSGEEGSWLGSLPELADVLIGAGFGSAWIALEYNPYQAGNGRADAVILGSREGKSTAIVVELKQWSRARWDPVLERAVGFGARYGSSAHPYRQADDYAGFIRSYTRGFHQGEAVVLACAFLHNATGDSIRELRTAGTCEAACTFAGDTDGRDGLVEFLQANLDVGDGERVARTLQHAGYEQGPEVLAAAADLFQDPNAFPLSPEQREIAHQIQAAVHDTRDPTSDRDRAVIVVKGRPGSGKTFIAAYLLGLNAQAGYQVSLATNSSALRTALQTTAKAAGQRDIAGMITSARTYWDDQRWGTLDVLVVDEAQRVTKHTIRTGFGNRKDIQANLEARNITQLFELTKTAKVVVLMIDEGQSATATDHLTMSEARDTADRVGASFHSFELLEQHRSAGSKAYEEWVDSLVDAVPQPWVGDPAFTVEVADDPHDLENRLASKDSEDVRILAGFCWDWTSVKSPGSLSDVPEDVRIGAWRKRWNLAKAVDGHPGVDHWATDPLGRHEVGSQFTAQGFEFDYCGVIIGPDFVAGVPGQRLVVDIGESKYRKLVGLAKDDPTLIDRIRNQYRVLLTRARRGVVIYAVDDTTQQVLKALLRAHGKGS